MNKIEIELHHSILPLQEIWQQMDRQAEKLIEEKKLDYSQYSFYQTYEWNKFLDRHQSGFMFNVSLKRKDYIVLSIDGIPFVIVPLLIRRTSRKITLISGKIAGILNTVSPYVNSPEANYVFDKVVEYLRQRYKGWNFCFHDIPRHTPFLKALIRSFNARGLSERGSYHIDLSRYSSFDKYLPTLSKNMYKNIRKAYNHLLTDKKQWSIKIYRNNNLPPTSYIWQIWQIYFLRKLAWKKLPATPFMHFVCKCRGLKEALWGLKVKSMRECNESELVVLEIDGKIASFMHVYRDYPYILMPKLAINASFSRYSPGIIMLIESLKRYYNEGIIDFDMCRGDERYKRDMGGVCTPLGAINIKES